MKVFTLILLVGLLSWASITKSDAAEKIHLLCREQSDALSIMFAYGTGDESHNDAAVRVADDLASDPNRCVYLGSIDVEDPVCHGDDACIGVQPATGRDENGFEYNGYIVVARGKPQGDAMDRPRAVIFRLPAK